MTEIYKTTTKVVKIGNSKSLKLNITATIQTLLQIENTDYLYLNILIKNSHELELIATKDTITKKEVIYSNKTKMSKMGSKIKTRRITIPVTVIDLFKITEDTTFTWVVKEINKKTGIIGVYITPE